MLYLGTGMHWLNSKEYYYEQANPAEAETAKSGASE